MRKEAIQKNKIEFAKVKRVNEMYLAEDESRQQVTYQRLYQKGTKKIKEMRKGVHEEENLSPQRTRRNVGDRLSFADVSKFTQSPQ